jgi:KRAB domain-containing zinc finger protein
MVHENKKKYKCDVCAYSAFQHADLKRHIECVHEKIKSHKCNICDKSFGLEGNLKTHTQKLHKNKEKSK